MNVIIPENIPMDYSIPYEQEFTFIICHKPLEKDYFQDISLRQYITDQNVPYCRKIPNQYDSRIYGELGFWKWIATQIRDCDRASLYHYRRRLPFSMSPVVVAAPIKLDCSVLEQTAFYHSPKLVDAMRRALPPEEIQILNGNLIYPYCIAKMPRQVIWDFVNFIEPRMIQIIKELGCPTEIESLKKWVANDETFCKPVDGKDTRPEYQARIGGFLGERLATIFWTMFSQRNPIEVREIKLLEPGQKI